tara:strand:- start:57 stop:437 length:381 start_codon:yes stop_codon:yes gene_type:complete
MAHFAKINSDNIVTEVIVINNDVILDSNGNEQESLGVDFCKQLYGDGTYKQTSYNSNLRKNMATVGSTYDASKDAFIRPKRYSSWVLDESTCRWKPPVEHPSDSEAIGGDVLYQWDESVTNWKVTT